MSRRPAHSLSLLSLAVIAASALAGCTAPAAGGGTGPVLTIDDLRGIVEEGDGLESLDFEASEVETTAADDLESMAGYWDESEGDPGACFDIFASSYLIAGTESGDGGDDPTIEIAFYQEPGADDLGLVIVNGRIFDDGDDARSFLDSRDDAADRCPDGYTLSADGDVIWTATGFEFGELPGAPEGVETVTIDEVLAGDSAAQRAVYVQRGNAVVAVYGEEYEGGTFEVSDLDVVAAAIADRLAAE